MNQQADGGGPQSGDRQPQPVGPYCRGRMERVGPQAAPVRVENRVGQEVVDVHRHGSDHYGVGPERVGSKPEPGRERRDQQVDQEMEGRPDHRTDPASLDFAGKMGDSGRS